MLLPVLVFPLKNPGAVEQLRVILKEGRETRQVVGNNAGTENKAMQVMDFRFDHLQGGDGGHGEFILKRNSKLDESVALSGEEC